MADAETSEDVVQQAGRSDAVTLDRILERYRARLHRFADRRLDARVSARIDSSDIVQDVLGAAAGRIPGWLDDGKPLSACLYRLMRDRLARVCRDHIGAAKRSVAREVRSGRLDLEGPRDALIDGCAASGDSPSRLVQRRETETRVYAALERLRDVDRQVVTMRILEGRSARATAEALGLSEHAVHMRQLRALKQLHGWLGES